MFATIGHAMEKNNKIWNSMLKVGILAVIALLLLIPLSMVRSQIKERSVYHTETIHDITKNWGSAQLFSGPWISYKSAEVKGKDKSKADETKCILLPDSLKYSVKTTSQLLHRSIFDVPVYTAEITVSGRFVLDGRLPDIGKGELIFSMLDLKGLQDAPEFTLGGKPLELKSDSKGLLSDISFDKGAKEGDVIPFRIIMKTKGSESIFFRPIGKMTEVEMVSDYPDPSFGGDFLPAEREVREDGFTARWLVSSLAVADMCFSSSFGVTLVKPVTQYRQTERATKYGILVIFLVLIAGFVVEIVSKKPINLIQYMVIGASLVLFYSLLLAFSDFLSFGYSYLIASVMTTASLGGYFIGIVKNKWAGLLTGLVALAYGTIYVLLQMETFSFLAGTLILFLILCVIMLLTRRINVEE